MKKLILIVLCWLCYFGLHAQFILEYNISYASYNMKDIKDLLGTIERSELLQKLGIRNVENFPGYVAHTANIGYKINRHEFGFKSSFYTTGGKLSVADYSGAVNVKMTTNGFREGLYYKNHFYSYNYKNEEKFSIWGEISPAVIFSKLKLKTEVRENNIPNTIEDFSFNSTAFAVLPQLGGKYYITKHISFDISVGYEFSFGGKYDDLSNSPRPNWSGIRLNGGIGYKF